MKSAVDLGGGERPFWVSFNLLKALYGRVYTRDKLWNVKLEQEAKFEQL